MMLNKEKLRLTEYSVVLSIIFLITSLSPGCRTGDDDAMSIGPPPVIPPPKSGYPIPDVAKKTKDTRSEIHTYTEVQIYYATDRLKSGDPKPSQFFGSDRGELTYGTCQVSIPIDHQPGEREEPSVFRLDFSEDPEKHIVLLSVNPIDGSTFFSAIADSLGEHSEDKS